MDTPRKGSGAMAVRIPAVAGLHGQLDVARSLRGLGRGVPSTRRFTLDETATAESIADNHVFDMVLRPLQDRWLDLVVAVDNGISLRVWHDTVAELSSLLTGFGIFRAVRVCSFDPEADTPTTSVDGRILAPFRTIVLVVSDGVGTGWHTGQARRHLARWARTAHTAVLNPLPARLWNRTGLGAQRMTVRTLRPAPTNRELSARDTLLPRRFAAPLRVPVPVLELGPWELKPWADLIARGGGTARLRVIDVGPGARVRPLPPTSPNVGAEERILAFRDAVSSEAYTLAGHLASIDPLTLPVMRVVQDAAVPGSSPACLSEVLLSGLMRVEPALDGVGGTPAYDVFGFEPEIRQLLTTTIRTGSTRRTVDQVTQYIAPRLDRIADFPALLAERTGTLALPRRAEPFAELPGQGDHHTRTADGPDLSRIVRVSAAGGLSPSTGYIVAESTVLTVLPNGFSTGVEVEVASPREELYWSATVAWRSDEGFKDGQAPALLRVRGMTDQAAAMPVRWGPLTEQQALHIAWWDELGPNTATAESTVTRASQLIAISLATPALHPDTAGTLVFQDGALAGIAPTPGDLDSLWVIPLSAHTEDPSFEAVLPRSTYRPPAEHNLPGMDPHYRSHAAYQWVELSLSHGERLCVLSGGHDVERSGTAVAYARDHLSNYDVAWRIDFRGQEWQGAEALHQKLPPFLRQGDADREVLVILEQVGRFYGAEELLNALPGSRSRLIVTTDRDTFSDSSSNSFVMVTGQDSISRAQAYGVAASGLISVLAWYGDEVRRDMLQPLNAWSAWQDTNFPRTVEETVETLVEAGLVRSDGDIVITTSALRQTVRAAPLLWSAGNDELPVSGRDIALALLLEHCPVNHDAAVLRNDLPLSSLTLITPQVLALAGFSPPEDDNQEMIRLFYVVGVHLVRQGHAEGVGLGERACARDRRLHSELYRRPFIEAALCQISTALALPPEAADSLGLGVNLRALLNLLSQTQYVTDADTRTSRFAEALRAATDLLGPSHPLTNQIRTLLQQTPGSGP